MQHSLANLSSGADSKPRSPEGLPLLLVGLINSDGPLGHVLLYLWQAVRFIQLCVLALMCLAVSLIWRVVLHLFSSVLLLVCAVWF
jgi:hypothetical protein